jgi:guanidinopropionase
MDESLKKLVENWKTFTPQMFGPQFSGISTFFGIPLLDEIKDLDIALVGVPFDSGLTVRPGTRFGPREIRYQSKMVGFYNHYSRMSPFANRRVSEMGDVPILNPHNLEDALKEIEAFYQKVSAARALPVTAGGDHSITFPILKAIAQKEKVGLIHFDSHCDTALPGTFGSDLTHGSPMRNAVEAELVDPKRTVQIGIRGFAEVLWEFSYQCGMQIIHIDEFYEMGWKKVVSDLRKKMGDGPVYISFDIDCLDPAFAPGTGTPVAGGMTTFEALQVLRGLRGLNIIGGDIVEVSPPYDPSGITALAGATIMFEILCLVAESPIFSTR